MRTSREKTAKRREIESLYPDLTWHFGISPTELAQMPRVMKEIYVDAIPRLIAQDQLRAIEASAYPHHDEQTQRSIHDHWNKFMPARKEEQEGIKLKTKEDVLAMGAMAGIGIVFEPKKGEEPEVENDA